MQLNSIPDNLLLRAAHGARRPTAQLQHITFEAGEQLWKSGSPVRYALFPVRGVVSLQVDGDRGKHVGIALLGREGCAEVSFFLGGQQTDMTPVGLTAGEALVMPADLFAAFLSDRRFRPAVERYTRLFLLMLNRISFCHRAHPIEKTLIGRLLMMQDRTQTNSFQLTQFFFSQVLGVRKATISRAAVRLHDQGLISYDGRGRLTILERRELEKRACSCYRAIKVESEELIVSFGGL